MNKTMTLDGIKLYNRILCEKLEQLSEEDYYKEHNNWLNPVSWKLIKKYDSLNLADNPTYQVSYSFLIDPLAMLPRLLVRLEVLDLVLYNILEEKYYTTYLPEGRCLWSDLVHDDFTNV
jgi:hypothetical protein